MTITDECARGDHEHCDYWPDCPCPCHPQETCDTCDRTFPASDYHEGAEPGGWDHPTHGAIPTQCKHCRATANTPPFRNHKGVTQTRPVDG